MAILLIVNSIVSIIIHYEEINIIFLIVFTQIPLCVETTRSDLAKIRVSKEGNFKYWKQDSQVIQKLVSDDDFRCKLCHARPRPMDRTAKP